MKSIIIAIASLLTVELYSYGQTGNTITRIELSKVTRGYQEHIRLSPDSVNVYVENIRADKRSTKYERKLASEEWTRLVKISQDVPLSDIPKLTSPSLKRAVDAAMHSTITIQTADGQSYSHGYDDEDPHKALQLLRKEIREISDTKQQ